MIEEEQSLADPDRSTCPVSMTRAIGWGLVSAGMLAAILVGWTYYQLGRSPAERAATALAMPIGTAWLLLFACGWASFFRSNRRIAILFWTSWLAVGVLFNGAVAGWLLKTREYPISQDPLTSINERLDAIVLLGGFAGDNRFGIPEVNSDGQRLVLAAQFWHAGKTRSIICTGTAAMGARDPADIGQQMLKSLGVPDEVIFKVPGFNTAGELDSLRSFFDAPPAEWLQQVSDHGRPTVESSQNTPELARSTLSRREFRVGLVTTSVHLSRAMRLAEGRQLTFVPLGCNFEGSYRPFAVRDLIPSAGAGKNFAVALKEWLGTMVGR